MSYEGSACPKIEVIDMMSFRCQTAQSTGRLGEKWNAPSYAWVSFVLVAFDALPGSEKPTDAPDVAF